MGFIDRFNNSIGWFEYCFMGGLFERKNYKNAEAQRLISSVELRPEEKKEIDDFYLKHYGKKVPYTSHRYIQAFNGVFNKCYIPSTISNVDYEFVVDRRKYADCMIDKNLLPMLAGGIPDLHLPETYVSCANGVFRDGEMHPLSRADAVKLLSDAGKLFIKPTVDSGSGKNCRVIELSGGTDQISGRDIEVVLRSYGKDFTVQRTLECADSIKIFNADSVNTFRVTTYVTPSGVIKAAPTFMRQGRKDSYLDNAHAGGVFVGVEPDGTLLERGYLTNGESFTQHPDSGICFKGYRIKEFETVMEKALQMHARIPQLGILNWDFTIDKENTPLLIEINIIGGSYWGPQIAHEKGLFGDDTIEILEYLRDMRKLYPGRYC